MRKAVDAPTLEETRRRVEMDLKPLDQEAKREILTPIIKRIYVDYLQLQQKK